MDILHSLTIETIKVHKTDLRNLRILFLSFQVVKWQESTDIFTFQF